MDVHADGSKLPHFELESGSNYGQVTLWSGAAPQSVYGTFGGPLQAAVAGGGCGGTIAPKPDHLLLVEDDIDDLEITIESQGWATLVIKKDTGEVWCTRDDRVEVSDGVLTIPTDETPGPLTVRDWFEPGLYAVWVGSARGGEFEYYQAYLTDRGRAESEVPGDPRSDER
jgi:hypothetical protein